MELKAPEIKKASAVTLPVYFLYGLIEAFDTRASLFIRAV